MQSLDHLNVFGLFARPRLRGVSVLAGLLLAAGLAVPSAAASSRPSGDPSPNSAGDSAVGDSAAGAAGSGGLVDPRPMRAVILVDESGSLDNEAVQREKDAAQLLAFSSLTPDSEIAVVGFGSSNGDVGQQAVEVYCPLTKAEPAKQQFLVDCIGGLHRREPSEGSDTDHVAAVSQALSILGPAQEGRPSFIFLLTDGRLDVSNSPQYGREGVRNTEAQRRLTAEIAKARSNGVQIWPLGFGAADKPALDEFAAGGAQQTCNNLPENQPKARLATSQDEVTRSLFEAIGNANCARTTDFDTDELSPGSQVELSVSIPEISTDGVIVAVKGDPRVKISYLDPNGTDVSDREEFDNSRFTRSTPNGTVESLRVQNPRPGTWKVRFTAPGDVSSRQTVGAAAMWQGVLQAVVALDPPQPERGQQAVVSVELQTRDGVIRDPRTLEGVQFGARMSGAGFAERAVPLVDDGTAGDARDGDAVFGGQITIPPDADGALTIRATVTGPGVIGTSVNYQTVLPSGPTPITASMELADDAVAPGGSLPGTIVIDNVDGRARTLSLQLRNLPANVHATIDPATLTSAQAGRTEHRFTVSFAEDTARGETGGMAVLVDAAEPSAVLAWARVGAEVRTPDSWMERFWWLLVLAAAVLLAVVLLAARVRQTSRAAGAVSGVTVHLSRDGSEVGSLPARPGTGGQFVFTVHDATGAAPRLDYAYGAGGYVVTRDRHRVLRLRTPDGVVHELSNRTPVPIGPGLAVTVTEDAAGSVPVPVPGTDDVYERAGEYGRDAAGAGGPSGGAAGGAGWDGDWSESTTQVPTRLANLTPPVPPARPARRSWRPRRPSHPPGPASNPTAGGQPRYDDLSD